MINRGEIGIELTADCKYYALVSDGAGGLVRKGGFDGEGTWDSSQQGAAGVQFNCHREPNQGEYTFLRFQDSPRRFSGVIYGRGTAVYVLVP